MLDVIEKLLALQERDQKILGLEGELANIEPERRSIQARLEETLARFEASRHHFMLLESERKKLELEADSKREMIQKFSVQQFQTKKNDEYRALENEIQTCKDIIRQLEDQQLELMEQAELSQKELEDNGRASTEIQNQVQFQISALDERKKNLEQLLAGLHDDHGRLEEAVEEKVRNRYQRLRKQKGANSVVGIEHGVCGGCHMKLPPQVVITCQSQHEIVSCPNCGRILYYTPLMDLAVED